MGYAQSQMERQDGRSRSRRRRAGGDATAPPLPHARLGAGILEKTADRDGFGREPRSFSDRQLARPPASMPSLFLPPPTDRISPKLRSRVFPWIGSRQRASRRV